LKNKVERFFNREIGKQSRETLQSRDWKIKLKDSLIERLENKVWGIFNREMEKFSRKTLQSRD